MSLIYACIAPHAGDLIPETVTDQNIVQQTRQSMREMGEHLQALNPEVLVIANPHGFRVQEAMSISVAERAVGDWSPDVKLDFEMDPSLANAIADQAEEMKCLSSVTFMVPAADRNVIFLWIGVLPFPCISWDIASNPSRNSFT